MIDDGKKSPLSSFSEQTNYIPIFPAKTVIKTLTPWAEASYVSYATSYRENVASLSGPNKNVFVNARYAVFFLHFCATSADFSPIL